MLNHIWAFLIVVGIFCGFSSAVVKMQRGEAVSREVDGKTVTEVVKYDSLKKKLHALAESGNKITEAAFNAVAFKYTDENGKQRNGAVGMAFDLIGIMALWLGMMKIAEKSGIIAIIARMLRPVLRLLFPNVPVEHPAAGAMLMTFAANIMGLDNATTPLAIKAMKELQTLNGDKTTASNSICMFVSINLASMVLMPATIIGYRIATGSQEAMKFVVPFWLASIAGLITAFVICRIAEKFTPDTPRIPFEEAMAASASNEKN